MVKEKIQRFSIRKLTVGTASVLIGLSFLGFKNSNKVQAAELSNKQSSNQEGNKDTVKTETKDVGQGITETTTTKTSTETSSKDKDFDTKYKLDPSLEPGTTKVIQEGQKGKGDSTKTTISEDKKYDIPVEVVVKSNPIEVNAQEKTSTQTINFVDESGNKLHDSTISSFIYKKAPDIVEKATGELIKGGQWNYTSHTFNQVNVPVIAGYVAETKQAGGLTSTLNDLDVEQTIVFKKIGHIVPVDPTGTPIPDQKHPQFPNEPDDPTKAIPGQKPNIPGYHPESGKPGDSVNPNPVNPSKDVPIVYVKDQGAVSVIFHDDTTNSTIPGVGFHSGNIDADTPVEYSLDKNISDLEKQGYVYVGKDGNVPVIEEIGKKLSLNR
ncbi:YSIRK-type signal peptide-containing protein [Lactobacillus iners]|uniref:mucin-binding protein n=1 Tax=Lactobacillus iners TaxID=147802 RepID=UPI003369FE7A|nr:YSIRK-type signal peptide-containing protein [Lactobacillus crispatus]MCT7739171.1 YSIRK-type signal peptide-containing protein [Lactobacillus iners]